MKILLQELFKGKKLSSEEAKLALLSIGKGELNNALIASFLLIHKKEKKYNFLKKYIVFSCAFLILVFAETTLRYSGFSLINFAIYFFTPIIFLFFLYLLLVKKMIFERTI